MCVCVCVCVYFENICNIYIYNINIYNILSFTKYINVFLKYISYNI